MPPLFINNVLLTQKIDTPINWTINNPILPVGVMGFEQDGDGGIKKFKVGDGITAWNDLEYAITGSSTGSSSYKNITPFINIADTYIEYTNAAGAYYNSGDYVNIHFSITAKVDKENLDPSVPINIVLNGAPEFKNTNLINMDLGSIIILGFGNVNEVSARGILNTSAISLKAKAVSSAEGNTEFMTTLTVGDIQDSEGNITINGVLSYFGDDIMNITGITMNVPSPYQLSSQSIIGCYSKDNINYVQFYAIISCENYESNSDNSIPIKILLPDGMPNVRSISNSFISGDIHATGLNVSNIKISAENDSNVLTLVAPRYQGTQILSPVLYGDLMQNSMVISGTFIYFGA